MARGILRAVDAAIEGAREEVRLSTADDPIARGLASEGYFGGYLAALYDVVNALNGMEPTKWRQWRLIAEEKQGRPKA